MWEALLEELRAPPAREVAELADRLAYVCATALATALAGTAGASAASSAGDRGPGAGEPDAPDPGLEVSEREAAGGGPGAGVLIDEREDVPPAPADGAGAHQPGPAESGPGTPAQPLPWELAAADAEAPIAIRDERREEGPAAWIRSIKRQLDRFAQDQLAFAVLLVDLGGIERASGDALSGGGPSLARQVERALARQLHLDEHGGEVRGHSTGSLTCERPGRYWLLATETDAIGARTLAEAIVRAIRPLTASRWPRPEVTVGAAVCPDDGRDAAALAACADVAIYTARRAGQSIASVDEPA
jgi:GGDEF domain-containing protein